MSRYALLVVLASACGRIGIDPVTAVLDATGATTDTSLDAPSGPQLVLHLPLDADCRDQSANAFPMTCPAGQCPTPTAGRVGGALQFTNDYCTTPDDPRLHLTSGFTVSLWVRPTQPTNYESAISKPLTTGPGGSFELATGDVTSIFCTTAPPMNESCLQGPPVPVGGWTHVALVWDSAQKQMLHDGAPVASEPHVTIWDDQPLYIGIDVEDGGFRGPFPGDIDEVRIYAGALDAASLAALANP
jgi:hypothetical protein